MGTLSYVEANLVPAGHVRSPARFVAHAWQRPFHELVSNVLATERQLALDEARGGGKDEAWMDVSLWIGTASFIHSLIDQELVFN
jgi:hypothetical protein